MRAADPGLFALKGAVRAAIVLPILFAVSLGPLDAPQTALFAAFGTMAVLVFVDVGGARRARLGAYGGLGLAGGGLIALGTLCSHSTALATVAMAAVAFAILFAGVLGGYLAALQPAAILAFVLPVMVPASAEEIPARLLGWGLATVCGAAAALLLWPGRPRDALRADAAGAARALADLVEAIAGGDRATTAAAVAQEATTGTYRRFVSLPHRPNGTSGPTAALGRLIDDLGWLRRIATLPPAPSAASTGFAAERKAIEAAVPEVLRGAGRRLDGAPAAAGPDLEGLERQRLALGNAFLADVDGLAARGDEAAATAALDEAYRLRQLAFRTLQVARRALQVCGDQVRADGAEGTLGRLGAEGRLAHAHASMRSVWFRNSLRGAIGLALAVFVGHVADVQHAFWVVLGTMSVLRSNAVTTGTTIVAALLGTLAGIVAGGLLVAAIGDQRAILWAVLPLAVLLAAYARSAISFGAGQAAFSLVVLVLFNLIEPVGWQVGIARIEDVAIGSAVSLAVGLLLWPRGAASVLREALGNSYRSAAHYLDTAIASLLSGGGAAALEDASREALETARLLDATARDYLSQRGSNRTRVGDLTRLIAGATRVRRVAALLRSAHMLARLTPIDEGVEHLAVARDAFSADYRSRCAWFEALGAALATRGEPPPPEPTAAGDAAVPVVLDGRPTDGELPPGLAIAWADRHLDTLLELEPGLTEATERLLQRGRENRRAALRRRPGAGLAGGGAVPRRGPARPGSG